MAQQAKSDEMEQEARSSSSVITADVSRADNFIVQNDRNSLDPSGYIFQPFFILLTVNMCLYCLSVIITKPLEPETEKKGRFLIKNVLSPSTTSVHKSCNFWFVLG